MEDTLPDLLQRLAGGTNPKTKASVAALEETGLYNVSDLVWATESMGNRVALQEDLFTRAREQGVHLPSGFVEGLRIAVQESRLAYSGFPNPPPATSTAILFTAPHALYLQRPGHKPHKPEAYTQHLARDFAQIVGGAFLTWTRREEARAKEYYKTHGRPDATNADPNFTLCSELDVSPWTRNLREVRGLFGVGRPCLHVDLHGCKDPGPDSGSDLVVGIGALARANQTHASFFKLALGVLLGGAAFHGITVNMDPTKLTGVSPDGDRRTLTQQSVSEEGGSWTYAVQLELSRRLRLELSRKRDMRTIVAKAILIAFTLAYAWQWKPVNCLKYPIQEVKDFVRMTKAFHARRRKQLARSARAAVKETQDAAKEQALEEADGPIEPSADGPVEPSADAEFEDEHGKAGGAAIEVGGTANTEPTVAAFTEPIEEWWADKWTRWCQDSGKGAAASLDKWLDSATESMGQTGRVVPPVKSEIQVLRQWLMNENGNEHNLDMLLAKATNSKQCYVIGTWNDWQPSPMEWDGFRFTYQVEVGDNGWESFQLMMNQKWEYRVHPSCQDANPWIDYCVQGPDNKGHGKNWTIGNPPGKEIHKKNAAKPGQHFQIVATLDEHHVPTRVSWKSWT